MGIYSEYNGIILVIQWVTIVGFDGWTGLYIYNT